LWACRRLFCAGKGSESPRRSGLL